MQNFCYFSAYGKYGYPFYVWYVIIIMKYAVMEGVPTMKEIIKICIKGESGYGCIEEAYHDRLVIVPDGMIYEYLPAVESEINPKRKWKYTTNSPMYGELYKKIAEMVTVIINAEITEKCTDIGGIEFQITYADKSKVKKLYWVSGDYFAELFRLIKNIVPICESTPVILLASEDE